MSPNCIDVERIADVETAPDGHPLRQHVAQCPRCQSLWLSYQSFMKADVTGASQVEVARAALAATIRRQANASADATPRTSRMEKPSRWAAWLRPALVTSMVAVLAIVAISVWRGGGSDEPVLRGDASAWTLHTPRIAPDSIILQWDEVADADAYDVQLFDDALNEVYTSGPVHATTVTIVRGALPSVASGASLTWRVRALRAGDVISTSPPSSLTVP
jgi:hypothetical protein